MDAVGNTVGVDVETDGVIVAIISDGGVGATVSVEVEAAVAV